MAIAIFVAMTMWQGLKYARARDYVLANKDAAIRDLAEAEVMSQHPDVKQETRNKLLKLKRRASYLSFMSETEEGVNWPIVQEDIDDIWSSLSAIVSDMEEQIGFDRSSALRLAPFSAGSDS
ncbi:MAG TPA: hypothetical protein VHD37_00750 [Candidatus Paceibacterota bacterium]|nr:hypothetical protein [Candidatus Paceibacterota bacterium]